jgi:hypothetical protein
MEHSPEKTGHTNKIITTRFFEIFSNTPVQLPTSVSTLESIQTTNPTKPDASPIAQNIRKTL